MLPKLVNAAETLYTQRNQPPVNLNNKQSRALLNWVSYLSRYEPIGKPPAVHFVSTYFFITNACAGRRKCRVLGWYTDHDIAYIHENLADMEPYLL